jgi:hypothetical protein
MRFWFPLAMPLALCATPAAVLAQVPEAASVHAAPKALDISELAQINGGQAITVVSTTQALSAVNTGNSIVAGSVRSGDISFSNAALSNFAGVGNFVVNTGANNNLQGNLSVTVVAAPPVTGLR